MTGAEPSISTGAVVRTRPLRIGILGAARITSLSLVEPARATGHRLVAVAARDPRRAEEFAAAHGAERAVATYDDVINDPEVDVVYNPLPNAVHATWNLRAAEAGKHVIAEKPSAMNAAEARSVAAAVDAAGVRFIEAFHYPYHPLFGRIRELLDTEAVGRIEHIEATLRMPAPPEDDPRWSATLGGGSTMDLGCYALSCIRLLSDYAGGAPRIVAGRVDERAGRGVDERLFVDLEFPSGATGLAGSDMDADTRAFHLTVRGTDGELHVPSFAVPSEDNSLVLRRRGAEPVVEHHGLRSSYTYQLEAFADAVATGDPIRTDHRWAVEQAEIVDAAYAAAGFAPRAGTRA